MRDVMRCSARAITSCFETPLDDCVKLPVTATCRSSCPAHDAGVNRLPPMLPLPTAHPCSGSRAHVAVVDGSAGGTLITSR